MSNQTRVTPIEHMRPYYTCCDTAWLYIDYPIPDSWLGGRQERLLTINLDGKRIRCNEPNQPPQIMRPDIRDLTPGISARNDAWFS